MVSVTFSSKERVSEKWSILHAVTQPASGEAKECEKEQELQSQGCWFVSWGLARIPHGTWSAGSRKEEYWCIRGARIHSGLFARAVMHSTSQGGRSGRSYSPSSFLARTRHEYGPCGCINDFVVPIHYYCTFTICLIPFPQITRALLIMFPWGELQLIGNESGKIKEHWLLKYIKHSFLRQREGERRGWVRRRGPPPGKQTLWPQGEKQHGAAQEIAKSTFYILLLHVRDSQHYCLHSVVPTSPDCATFLPKHTCQEERISWVFILSSL